MIAITEKNFKCNTVSKKRGDEITLEELKEMKEFAHQFSQDGLILITDEKVKKEIEKVAKEAKKAVEDKKNAARKKMEEVERIRKAQNKK